MPQFNDADGANDAPQNASEDSPNEEEEGAFVDPDVDEDAPVSDGSADADAIITCPYCGEQVEIALDAGGGVRQDYVEDCEVCCQPWQLSVHYGADGHADVQVTPLDE
jgi:Cysteine-rich CPXCG